MDGCQSEENGLSTIRRQDDPKLRKIKRCLEGDDNKMKDSRIESLYLE